MRINRLCVCPLGDQGGGYAAMWLYWVYRLLLVDPPLKMPSIYDILLEKLGGIISLGDGGFYANFLGFRGSVPLLPHLCPLSVP